MLSDIFNMRGLLALITWIGTSIFIGVGVNVPDYWIGFMGAINAWYFQSAEIKTVLTKLIGKNQDKS